MSTLIRISWFFSPMLVPLMSCRMLKLTFDFGFCDETVVGLVSIAQGVFIYCKEICISKAINQLSFARIKGHPKEHSLRARLTVIGTTVFVNVYPFQIVSEMLMEGYTSATIVG